MEQLPTSTGDRESVLTVVAPRSLARAGFFRAIGAVGRVLPAAPLAPTQNGFGGIRG
jgi:hypothetical protein